MIWPLASVWIPTSTCMYLPHVTLIWVWKYNSPRERQFLWFPQSSKIRYWICLFPILEIAYLHQPEGIWSTIFTCLSIMNLRDWIWVRGVFYHLPISQSEAAVRLQEATKLVHYCRSWIGYSHLPTCFDLQMQFMLYGLVPNEISKSDIPCLDNLVSQIPAIEM